jgi:sec-independent protein translocase protein TatB
MFGIGTQELLIILVVALIFIGPRKLPEIARTLGKGYRELKRAADDIKDEVDLDSILEEEEEGYVKRSSSVEAYDDSLHQEAPSTSPSENPEADPANESQQETISKKTEA